MINKNDYDPINKNDYEKDVLANQNGYTLIRVEENQDRKVNFLFEIQKIKEIILGKNEI